MTWYLKKKKKRIVGNVTGISVYFVMLLLRLPRKTLFLIASVQFLSNSCIKPLGLKYASSCLNDRYFNIHLHYLEVSLYMAAVALAPPFITWRHFVLHKPYD